MIAMRLMNSLVSIQLNRKLSYICIDCACVNPLYHVYIVGVFLCSFLCYLSLRATLYTIYVNKYEADKFIAD